MKKIGNLVTQCCDIFASIYNAASIAKLERLDERMKTLEKISADMDTFFQKWKSVEALSGTLDFSFRQKGGRKYSKLITALMGEVGCKNMLVVLQERDFWNEWEQVTANLDRLHSLLMEFKSAVN